MNVLARLTAVGLAAAATLTLAACSSGTTTSSGSTSSPATSTPGSTSTSGLMTSGGRMTSGGMMPSVALTSAAMSSGAMSSMHNDADVTFTQQMIVHHQGAIEMADLAPTRAVSQQVKDLAVTIKAAQGPEIERMTSWLQAWGTDAGTDMNGMPNPTNSSAAAGGMGGMGGSDTATRSEAMSSQMPGMMSADETSQLTAATGTAFDKMFLQMMITHHQGAVEMADTEIAQGSNPDALTLAQSIKTSQTAEITTMQQLLQTL